MEPTPITWTLYELAEIVGGELNGPADLRISRPVPAGDNDPEGITFAETEEYLGAVEKSDVGAVIVNLDETRCTKPHIKCRSPREAFVRILAMASRELPIEEGVHPTAIVSQDAEVEPGAFIGAFCVVETGSLIETDVKVYPFCYVGPNCLLKQGSRIYPHVTMYADVHVGERSIVHAGSVLGADGFGYYWDGKRHRKVPQVGGVRIGDDCEIGALTAIDRATAGETWIKNGVKLDNLVQVAHNVTIGNDTVIASQTGIGGSTTLGARNIVAGQCGFKDHISTTDDVNLGASTGVMRGINEPGNYWGWRARNANEEKKTQAALERLPDLIKRVRSLEAQLQALQEKNED